MSNNLTISDRYKKALEEENLLEIQELISELNSLSSSDKKSNRALYAKIEDDLFVIGVAVPNNFDLKKYDEEIAGAHRKKVVKKETPGRLKDFDEIFCEFHTASESILTDLKYHFVFHLIKDEYEEVNLLILTDETYHDNPLIEKISNASIKLNPKKSIITDFIDSLAKTPKLLECQYLLLLVISPTFGDTTQTRRKLEELFSHFDKCYLTSTTKVGPMKKGDYSADLVDRVTYDEIEKITSNILNNKAISHEEEKVIKLCLSKNTAITDYKILKAGFSGAKVIEVKPIRYITVQDPIRFVIKFSYKTAERKLQAEKEAFKRCLQELKVEGYTCEYVETEMCEAIQYNYASSDSKMDSLSFATLIDNSQSVEPKPTHDLEDTLEQLFCCAPFAKWNPTMSKKNEVSHVYSKYIDEEKICKWISLIDNISDTEVKSSSLWINYKTIMAYNLSYKEKICHGDLHTENFFKDDRDVYLIDFGYTCENHAIIDHTTLEASIKFKHIQSYVTYQQLKEIEENFFSFDSLKDDFDLSFIKRPQLLTLFKLINKIRKNATTFLADPSNNLEYLISLFILTFRQIQYKDLNQRFALESAKVLGEHVCNLIKQS